MTYKTSLCTHTEGKRHNCNYVDERDKLIPLAYAKANALVGPVDRNNRITWSNRDEWDRVFLSTVSELSRMSQSLSPVDQVRDS